MKSILKVVRVQNISILNVWMKIKAGLRGGEYMEMNYGKVIVSLLKQARTTLDKNIRDYFGDCGLTMPQMAVLTILGQHGEMRISDISEKMGLTNSTTSGIIDRLERMEIVERIRQDRDRRVVKVVLTQKASDVDQNIDLMMDKYFQNLFSKASEEDLKAVIKGFEIINKILRFEN